MDQKLREQARTQTQDAIAEYIAKCRIGNEPTPEEGVLVRVVTKSIKRGQDYRPYIRISFESPGLFQLHKGYGLASRDTSRLLIVSNLFDPDTWFWLKSVEKATSNGYIWHDHQLRGLDESSY